MFRCIPNGEGLPMHETGTLIPAERIERAILLIRGQKIMLDKDLATLYRVGTKVLIQAVKRNLARFPPDFMFQLSHDELENWRSQIVTSNSATAWSPLGSASTCGSRGERGIDTPTLSRLEAGSSVLPSCAATG